MLDAKKEEEKKKREEDQDKKLSKRFHGGQLPTETCTFPRGKKLYLFHGLKAEQPIGRQSH